MAAVPGGDDPVLVAETMAAVAPAADAECPRAEEPAQEEDAKTQDAVLLSTQAQAAPAETCLSDHVASSHADSAVKMHEEGENQNEHATGSNEYAAEEQEEGAEEEHDVLMRSTSNTSLDAESEFNIMPQVPDDLVVRTLGPPVRLRMTSADKYAPRCMIVDWTDNKGEHHWVSSGDPLQNGWYESEKLLSPFATHIRVHFKVKAPHMKPRDVFRAEKGGQSCGAPAERQVQEVIAFRMRESSAHDPVDVMFELKGPVHRCFLRRAWNAGGQRTDEDADDMEWEVWEDEDSRPKREGTPTSLVAADAAAPARKCDSRDDYLEVVAARFCAASLEMLGVHRETLRALLGLDESCTGHWITANTGTTVSAGLMIAAVPLIFTVPPVGLALALAGSITATMSLGGESLSERWNIAQLREQVWNDSWNAFVTAELMEQWLVAAAAVGTESPAERAGRKGRDRGEAAGVAESSGIGNRAAVYCAADNAIGATRSAAQIAAMFGPKAAMAVAVLGPIGISLGAVLNTGIAIHGWTTRKFSQKEVRRTISDLRDRILFIQYLLSHLGMLVCPLCQQSMSLEDNLRRCSEYSHYCHAACFESASTCTSCPTCFGVLEATARTIEEETLQSAKEAAENAAAQERGTYKLERLKGAAAGAAAGAKGAASWGMTSLRNIGERQPSTDLGYVDFEEGLIFDVAERLDFAAEAMSQPPAGADRVVTVAHKLQECGRQLGALERLAARAAEVPDRVETALAVADTLERLRDLRVLYDVWRGGLGDPLDALVSLPQEASSSRGPTEASSLQRQLTGIRVAAAQKASVMGQSASRGLSAVAVGAKGAASRGMTNLRDLRQSAEMLPLKGGLVADLDGSFAFETWANLDIIDDAMTSPPNSEEQVAAIAAELQECDSRVPALEGLMAEASEMDSFDLALAVSDILERFRGLWASYETWRGSMGVSIAIMASEPPRSMPALRFDPLDRDSGQAASGGGEPQESLALLSGGPADGSSPPGSPRTAPSSGSSQFLTKIQGMKEAAAQKTKTASALGQSASAKLSAATSDMKGRASSFLKGRSST